MLYELFMLYFVFVLCVFAYYVYQCASVGTVTMQIFRRLSWRHVIVFTLCVLAMQIVLSPLMSKSVQMPGESITNADPFFTVTPKRMRNCWRNTSSARIHLAVLSTMEVNDIVWYNLQLSARRFNYVLSMHHTLSHLKHHITTLPSHEIVILTSSASVLLGLPASSLQSAYFASKHRLIMSRIASEYAILGLISEFHRFLSSSADIAHFVAQLQSGANVWMDQNEQFISILSSQTLQNEYLFDANNLLISKLTHTVQSTSSQLLRHQSIAVATPSLHPPAILLISLTDSAAKEIYNRLGKQSFKYSPHSNAFTFLPPRSSYRVVVTLTSMPSRLPYLNETLLSLLDQHIQADAIYLNLPHRYDNYHEPFDIPASISHLPVIINRCLDYGPATKLIPTLEKENDPNTLIVAVDDDMIYKPTLLLLLLKRHFNNPTMVYANAGQLIDVDGEFGPAVVRTAYKWNDNDYPVDIIEAFRGVVYRRDFFDLSTLIRIPKECKYTDDIWFSAHLAAQDIPRIKLYEGWGDQALFSTNDAISPLRTHNTEGVRRNDVCALFLLDVFKRSWRKSPGEVCSFEFKNIL